MRHTTTPRRAQEKRLSNSRAFLGSAIVTVVQPTQASPRDHRTMRCSTTSARRGALVQPEMCSVLVIVGDVIGNKSLQMRLVQSNNVVEQFAAAGFHPALGDAVLPGALDRGLHAVDLHGSNRSRDFQSILRVVIE